MERGTSFFKREQSISGIRWSPQIDRLLRKWRLQIHIRRDRCAVTARRYRAIFYAICLVSTILTGVISASNITIFGISNQESCITVTWWNLFMGIIGIIATVATALLSTFDLSRLSESYRLAASKYSGLARDIDSILSIPVEMRKDPLEVLQHVRSRYDDAVETSPDIVQDIEDELGQNIKAVPPPAPSVIETPDRVVDINDLSNLNKILTVREEDSDDFDLDEEMYTDVRI